MTSKKGQEEMVGFALIIVIVSVIILVFLWFFLSNKGEVSTESYEAESFVTSILQISTSCEHYSSGFLDLKDLISYCSSDLTCLNDADPCEVLNETLSSVLESGWSLEDSHVKGYSMKISSETKEIAHFMKGNETLSSRSYRDKFSLPRADDIEISLKVFY